MVERDRTHARVEAQSGRPGSWWLHDGARDQKAKLGVAEVQESGNICRVRQGSTDTADTISQPVAERVPGNNTKELGKKETIY